MDLLGEAVRRFLKESRAAAVQNAHSLATELCEEGMREAQIEEMLYSSEFDEDIVVEAMSLLSCKKKGS